MLHITNGDAAVAVLRKSLIQGEFLPWRDVLHEGPVDASLPLDELSAMRAQFIAGAGWASLEDAEKGFRERDETLRRCAAHDEVVLWFEHDLYDQLQLVQVLAWFAEHPHPRVALVSEPEYLGIMEPERAAILFQARRPVRADQLRTALEAWRAFGSDDPLRLQGVDTKLLRFLPAALRRLMQEYPWIGDGLSRLERQVVDALELGPLPFSDIFRAVQEREDPIFLGDTVLRWHLERMVREGMLLEESGTWRLSGHARVMREPRWIGGVQIAGASPWRWDPASARLVALA